ncbi:MAG: response regulator [Bacteroidetes bacterium]|nr:response regulator [Bacteroidota bacterium]
MDKLRVLIIDDEEPARMLIREYLQVFSNVKIIGEASNGFEGVQIINDQHPDLIFLDIQMPKLTGFEMLELIDPRPYIIFSTAFDQYAIKAFEMSAVDYLLKPYSKERFAQAVNKVLKKVESDEPIVETKQQILSSLDDISEPLSRVALRIGTKIKVIPVDEISYLESDDDYVKIHTGEAVYLKEKTMKYFDAHLNSEQFVRIHRSFILNVNFLDRLERYEKDSYVALLKDQSKLKVSAAGYKVLKQVLKF